MTAMVWLKGHNDTQFDTSVANRLDKNSASYHLWMKPEEIAGYGPTASDLATVKASLKALGLFSSLPWMILLVVVLIASAAEDMVLRRSGSLWLARVPAAVTGFVIAALGLALTARTPSAGMALALLALGLGGMGFVQASTWTSIQEIGGGDTSILTAWNGMLTNGAAALGPMVMAQMVSAQGNWSGALTATAAAALLGAVTWTLIHARTAALASAGA